MGILIVDDSKAMRMIVTRTIRQAGYDDRELHEADNGVSGLAAVIEHRPELVLSDWNMPEMGGLEFLQQLRDRGDDVPFGFVTSEGSAEMRGLAARHGAAFLIAKPFGPDDFRSVIAAALR